MHTLSHMAMAETDTGSREQRVFAVAVQKGDADTVWRLFEEVLTDGLFKGGAGEALLVLAATCGNMDILQIFQNHGFQPHTLVRFGNASTMIGCSLRETDMVRLSMMESIKWYKPSYAAGALNEVMAHNPHENVFEAVLEDTDPWLKPTILCWAQSTAKILEYPLSEIQSIPLLRVQERKEKLYESILEDTPGGISAKDWESFLSCSFTNREGDFLDHMYRWGQKKYGGEFDDTFVRRLAHHKDEYFLLSALNLCQAPLWPLRHEWASTLQEDNVSPFVKGLMWETVQKKLQQENIPIPPEFASKRWMDNSSKKMTKEESQRSRLWFDFWIRNEGGQLSAQAKKM